MRRKLPRARAQRSRQPTPRPARAGRRHAADLARHGITAHLGTDGSRPEQRYTEAGGEDLALENAACLADAVARPLDPAPRFSRAGIARVERAFLKAPTPATMYLTAGHRTPRILQTDESLGHFWIELPLDSGAGLYEISVWAVSPGSSEMELASLRTLRVE